MAAMAAGMLMALVATPALADSMHGWISPRLAASPDVSLIGMSMVPDVRLRALNAPAVVPPMFGDPSARLRPGFGGAALDYFPFAHNGSDGVFVSMAARLTARPNWRANADTNGALLMRLQRDFGSRLSKRVTPAATVGYAKSLGEGMTLGLESGVMMGRASGLQSAMGGASRYRLGGDDRGKMNQVTRVSFAFKF